MSTRFSIFGACSTWVLAAIGLGVGEWVSGQSGAVHAAQPSDTLMPSTSRGYIAVPDVATLSENWRQTQMGQLVQDKEMQPFVADMKDQLQRKLSGVRDKLGVELNDFRHVASGEVALALIERPGERAAVAFTSVVEGREKEVETLLAKIDADLGKRGARRRSEEVAGATLTIYDIPAQGDQGIARQAIFFQRDGMLCGSDNRTEAEALLNRMGKAGDDSLSQVAAYQETMQRCAAHAAGTAPEARWYVDPFGYARSVRSLARQPIFQGTDYLRIFSEQGFNAIQGAGGYVNLAVGGVYELVHRTAVYAPPAPDAKEKYRLAMRMMSFPNSAELAPQSWIPRKLASYRTFNFDIQNGFEHFDTLFDALIATPQAFQGVVEGLHEDPYGPQIQLGDDFIAHLGTRITLVTDYEVPITTKSERYLILVQVTDEEAVQATVDKVMAVDKHAQRRKIDDLDVWEISESADEYDDLDFGDGELNPLGPNAQGGQGKDAGKNGPLIVRNSAVCVYDKHLMIASHLDFLRSILSHASTNEMLTGANDFQEIDAALEQLLSGPKSAQCFVRTDEAYRPTYELLRQGKMPEAETLLGRFLNRLLTSPENEEEGILRKQKIDGRQLPSFEMVRRYFSPSGTVVRSDDDGWFIVGATLAKRTPQARAGIAGEERTRR